jgi:hypothetical protein
VLKKNVNVDQFLQPLTEVECHEWIGNVWWNTKSFIIDNISFLSSFQEAPLEVGSGTSGIVYKIGSVALKISAHRTAEADDIPMKRQSPRVVGNGLEIYSEGLLNGNTFPGYVFKYRFMELLKNEASYSLGLSSTEARELFSSINFLIDSNFGVIPERISQLMYIADSLIIDEVVSYIFSDNAAKLNVEVINKYLYDSLAEDWAPLLVRDYLLLMDSNMANDISYHNLGLRDGVGKFVFFDIED